MGQFRENSSGLFSYGIEKTINHQAVGHIQKGMVDIHSLFPILICPKRNQRQFFQVLIPRIIKYGICQCLWNKLKCGGLKKTAGDYGSMGLKDTDFKGMWC